VIRTQTAVTYPYFNIS